MILVEIFAPVSDGAAFGCEFDLEGNVACAFLALYAVALRAVVAGLFALLLDIRWHDFRPPAEMQEGSPEDFDGRKFH